MPPFSFGGFALSDTPQKVIEKGMAEYSITTSFPVQQSGNAIKVDSGTKNFGYIRVTSRSLDQIFIYHKRVNQYVNDYNLGVSNAAIKAGLRIDTIELKEKGGSGTSICYYYYTLPGAAPKVLYNSGRFHHTRCARCLCQALRRARTYRHIADLDVQYRSGHDPH